jgi:transposase InsO family protein
MGFSSVSCAATSGAAHKDIFDVNAIVTLNDVVHVNDERFFISLSDKTGKRNEWLLDSGAAITAVDPTLIPEGLELEQVPPSFEARSASNHTLVARGVVNLPMRLGEKWLTHKVYVLEGLRTKAILGVDFIRRKNVVIEGGAGRVQISGVTAAAVAAVDKSEEVVRQEVRVPASYVALRPEKTVQVFPMSGVVVPLVMRKPMEEGTVGICSDSTGTVTEAIQEVHDGRVLVNFHNPTEEMLVFPKGEVAAFFQPMKQEKVKELMPIDEMLVGKRDTKSVKTRESYEQKRRYLRENFQFGGPAHFKEQFWQLVWQYEDVFSSGKFDLGRTSVVKHEIRLTEPHPVHKKQFRIPWDHQQLVREHIAALLRAKCIRTSRSPFNAPIFCVPKPHGGMRVVLDYRALNAQTFEDKYVIREVQECIDEIGKQGSRVFSALDLTSGFWQMELAEESKPLTAFSFPGLGRFEWEVAPMGLRGSPASFARLMDHVMEGLRECLTYIDDVLIHTRNFQQHLAALEGAFQRLRKFNLKLNIAKCSFAATEVAYLGFQLTSDGVKPNLDKVAAVREMPYPDSPRRVREFLGMSNYFRHFIKDFARISSPLSALTGHGISWKGGELPQAAKEAFEYLRTKLCEMPILTYPRADRPFALSVDAATGDEKQKGGLGAVLTQLDDEGHERVVAYASKGLNSYERNYSPYLLELQACTWAIEHFQVYLKGRHFVLRTDHKPLEKMSNMHKRTLNRLQEQMNEYSFIVQHKPGAENAVPDALSRNSRSIESISFTQMEIRDMQRDDGLVRGVFEFLANRRIPEDQQLAKKVTALAPMCILDGPLVRFQLRRKGFEPNYPLLAPELIRENVLRTAHASRFSGHGGRFRTFNNVCRVYWWPGLAADVTKFVEACPTCQTAKDPAKGTRVPLHPHEIPDRPNCRVHIDLFGPLKTSSGQSKYIMVMTDAFTKYAELAVLTNKRQETVAQAFLDRWVCRFTCPEVVISDQGKEFLNEVVDILFGKLGIEHRTTSAMRPQTNAAAEKFNREIIRYLKTALQGQTLDWEDWIPMLMISYNTQVHKATLNSPFFLTFLHDPRLPYFDMRAARPDYGESWPTEAFQRLKKAYGMAKERMEQQRAEMKARYDQGARMRPFRVGEQVLLYYPRATVTYGNPKLAAQWVGGFYVHQQLGPDTYWVRQVGSTSQGTTVHAARMKSAVASAPLAPYVPQPQPNLTRPGLPHLRGHMQGRLPGPSAIPTATGIAQPQRQENRLTFTGVSTRSRTRTEGADLAAFPELERARNVKRSAARDQGQVQEKVIGDQSVDRRAGSETENEEEQAAQAVWAVLKARRKRAVAAPAAVAAQVQPTLPALPVAQPTTQGQGQGRPVPRIVVSPPQAAGPIPRIVVTPPQAVEPVPRIVVTPPEEKKRTPARPAPPIPKGGKPRLMSSPGSESSSSFHSVAEEEEVVEGAGKQVGQDSKAQKKSVAVAGATPPKRQRIESTESEHGASGYQRRLGQVAEMQRLARQLTTESSVTQSAGRANDSRASGQTSQSRRAGRSAGPPAPLTETPKGLEWTMKK